MAWVRARPLRVMNLWGDCERREKSDIATMRLS